MTTWSVDLEAEAWVHYVYGHAVSDDGDSIALRSPRALADFYARTDAEDTILAHNGGRYDFLALLDAARGRWNARLAGAAIVSMQADGHAECRDTFRVVPFALRRFAAKCALDLPCRCGERCGGYCQIRRRGMPRAMRRRMEEYCAQDARALLDAWRVHLGWLEELGFAVMAKDGRPRRTLGSIAWATLRAWGVEPGRRLDRTRYVTQRRAYAGGRNELFRTRAARIHQRDVHMAYPWALTQPVPVGRERPLRGAAAARALADGRPGLYYCAVDVPAELPLLPHRSPRGRLLWATGRLEGWWPLPELAAAEEHGARILRCTAALVFPDEAPIYRDAMHRMRELRAAHWTCTCGRRCNLERDRDGQPAACWRYNLLKLKPNAVSGKLAQRPGQAELVIDMDAPPSERYQPAGPPRIGDCARPAHAAYLTGRVRGEKLLPALVDAGDGRVYTDTDSIKATAGSPVPAEPDVEELGCWKDEGDLSHWYGRAPKAYGGLDDDDEPHVRAKGAPTRDPLELMAYLAGGTVSRTKVGGIRRATGEVAWQTVEVERTIRSPEWLAGTRYAFDDGSTVALHRDRDGGYSWPGAPVEPADVTSIRARLK